VGIGGHTGQQEPLEFDKRLFKKDDAVEVQSANPGRLQAEVNRVLREIVIVLPASEALFLGSGDEPALAQQSRSSVVEVAGDSEDVAQNCLRARSRAVPSPSGSGSQPGGAPFLIERGSLVQRTAKANGQKTVK